MSSKPQTHRIADSTIVLVGLALLLALVPSARAASFEVTNPPSSQKVLPTAKGAGPQATTLRMAMSRGEYEPVQLVVHAGAEDLVNLRVTVTDLAGTQGNVIPKERVVVNPHGFLNVQVVTKGWTPLVGKDPGRVPDVLLPDRPMNVKAGERHPYYVTVQTLQSDQAGEYQGTVSITADGRQPRQLPLVVRVYDVVLPTRSHLRTSFGLDSAGTKNGVPFGYRKLKGADPARDLESLIKWTKFMLAHRVTPCLFGYSREVTQVPPIYPKDGNWDWTEADKYYSAVVPQGLTSIYTHSQVTSPGFYGHMKEKGWWDLVYVMMFDEAKMSELPKMRQQYRSIKQAVPDATILQTEWEFTPALEGLVDIWCPVMYKFDSHTVQEAHLRGDEVWWYTWTMPHWPRPNICLIDYPGIYARVTGWMIYAYKLDGFLYWQADIWDTHTNSPESMNTLSAQEHDDQNYANWPPDTYKKDRSGKNPRNGDGWLMYPDKDNNPVASLRLALTRDGFEDYDLFKQVQIMTTADDRPAVDRARQLLDFRRPFEQPLILSATKWVKDNDNAYLRRREEILKIGEELRRPDDERLADLRERQARMAADLYPSPVKEAPPKSPFGKTPPSEAHYVDGTDYAKLIGQLALVEELPSEGWLFRPDPDQQGVAEGFFRPTESVDAMTSIRIGQHWDAQGHEALKEGWYRLNFRCPRLPDDKRVFLRFHAVDESVWLYVDGELVAWYDTKFPFVTWTAPFLLDVTGKLKSGDEHVLVMRVGNSNGAGGIYRGVDLMVEK